MVYLFANIIIFVALLMNSGNYSAKTKDTKI